MDYAKITFCTPVFNDGDTVGQMIESILDQDYPAIEHILVNDGSKDKTKSVLDHYAKKYPEKIKVIHFPENRGACEARNEAAKHATGKYLSFLPADAVLYPGVARVWVNSLEERPEYDFLYGGYTFVDKLGGNKIQDYVSQEFDPYMLEVTNYIDGSYPLKKELFEKMGGWDSSIKSLQDWDFWLNAVKKHNAKGFYMPDLFFETTMPHKGGLSDDSANNWLARTRQIKKKYKITEKDICVCSLGAPFHGQNMAKLLGADYKEMPSFKPHNYKGIYIVGGYYSNFPYIVDAFKRHDGMRIMHWIGSDIWQLMELQNNPSPTAKIALGNFLEFLSHNVDVHLCEFDVTQKELKQFGIKAKIIPVPPFKLPKLKPLPEKFTVGVYLPYVNKNFYFPDLVMDVAKSMPDVEFKIFGDQTLIGKKDNIEHVGQLPYEEMEELIKNCSAILRLTPHDGLPLSVCEFIMAGRNAITNLPIPYVLVPKELSKENIIQAIEKCKKLPQNVEGSKYYHKLLDHKKFKKSIEKLLHYKYEDYWDKRARSWNLIKGNSLTGDGKEVEEKYIEFIEKSIKRINPSSVLDIGCGNGNWYHFLKDRTQEYKGFDVSKKLVEYAKSAHGDYFFQSNLLNVSEKLNKKYDLGFTFTTLLHVKPEDFQRAVEELRKSCKYGLFIEPIVKGDKNKISSRQLHPELVRDIYGKGLILQGVESSFIRNYRDHFRVMDAEEIGSRIAILVDLQ